VDKLGFPLAWPVGRFWPQGRTSGVAIGGLNLEFLQPDEGAPEVATITTLVFEPFDLSSAQRWFGTLGVPLELREKWEPDPQLLRLRGFDEEQSRTPQLICQNLMPQGPVPIPFFLCAYTPFLRERLSPNAFPGLPRIQEIVLALPDPAESDKVLHLLSTRAGEPRLTVDSGPCSTPMVKSLILDRGPIDLEGWPSTFQLESRR